MRVRFHRAVSINGVLYRIGEEAEVGAPDWFVRALIKDGQATRLGDEPKQKLSIRPPSKTDKPAETPKPADDEAQGDENEPIKTIHDVFAGDEEQGEENEPIKRGRGRPRKDE